MGSRLVDTGIFPVRYRKLSRGHRENHLGAAQMDMPQRGTPSKILVVEDDPMVSTVFRVALERAGHQVVHARDGKECVQNLASPGGGFDLLLSDVVLGDSDGVTTLDRLRAFCPVTPILMVSGYPLQVLVERGLLPDGAIDQRRNFFLQKPFMPAQLTAMVQSVLSSASTRAMTQAAGTER